MAGHDVDSSEIQLDVRCGTLLLWFVRAALQLSITAAVVLMLLDRFDPIIYSQKLLLAPCASLLVSPCFGYVGYMCWRDVHTREAQKVMAVGMQLYAASNLQLLPSLQTIGRSLPVVCCHGSTATSEILPCPYCLCPAHLHQLLLLLH